MDIIFLIRSLIFLTAGLVLLIFPKQILEWQIRWSKYFAKKLNIRYRPGRARRSGRKTNKILGVLFLVTAVILFLVAVK